MAIYKADRHKERQHVRMYVHMYTCTRACVSECTGCPTNHLPNFTIQLEYFESKMLYQHRSKPHHYAIINDGKRGNSNTQMNGIILNLEINQLHMNGFLLIYNICYNIMYILKWLAV